MKCFSKTLSRSISEYLVSTYTYNKDYSVDEKQIIRALETQGDRDLVAAYQKCLKELYEFGHLGLEMWWETHNPDRTSEISFIARIGAQILGGQ